MVSDGASEHCKPYVACIKDFLSLERPFLDLVSQTPRPRGRGRPLFAECYGPLPTSSTHFDTSDKKLICLVSWVVKGSHRARKQRKIQSNEKVTQE